MLTECQCLQLLNISLILSVWKAANTTQTVSVSTWVKENYGFQAGVFIVVYLKLLEGKHQLIQDPHCDPAHLQLWAVPGNDVVISCRKIIF